MEKDEDIGRFRDLRFADFSKMANDTSLKPYEKIGFPAFFREGFDSLILQDLLQKLPALHTEGSKIADIGCGCGELCSLLIQHSVAHNQKLFLIDSREVLDQLPASPGIKKIEGRFPGNDQQLGTDLDVIICYSVFHYVFVEDNPFTFIERALALLKPGGMFLLGDLPNVTKRTRFLNTASGVSFHQKLMKTQQKPEINFFEFMPGKMDDGFILGLLNRYRNFGVETYLLPQPAIFPLSTSRDDILFVKQ